MVCLIIISAANFIIIFLWVKYLSLCQLLHSGLVINDHAKLNIHVHYYYIIIHVIIKKI